jgi:hypothetical protein
MTFWAIIPSQVLRNSKRHIVVYIISTDCFNIRIEYNGSLLKSFPKNKKNMNFSCKKRSYKGRLGFRMLIKLIIFLVEK